jgi:hypothetical protein
MKTIYTNYLNLVLILFLVNFSAKAQLTPGGIYSVGPSGGYVQPSLAAYTGTFTTLTAAIAQLNASPATGNYIIELQNDYVSTSETFPINIVYAGTASAVATIRPRSDIGAGFIDIRGSVAAPLPLINFNGCKFVKIDGRPGGVGANTNRAILIENLATASVTNCAVQFVNGAVSDTLRSVEAWTNGGNVIFFSGGGNKNNYLESIYTDYESTSLPNYGILSTGTAGNENSDIVVKECIIANASQIGIIVNTNSTGWQIIDNWISTYTGVTWNTNSAIGCVGIQIAPGSGYTIRGNIIGDNFSGGNATYQNTNTGTLARLSFFGILVATPAGGTLSSISDNLIFHINVNTHVPTVGGVVFAGIQVQSGFWQIGGPSPSTDANIIGDVNGAVSSIVTTPSTVATNQYNVYGIRVAIATTTVNTIQNCGVGGIRMLNNNGQALAFGGIRVDAGPLVSSAPIRIRGCFIGSPFISNSINLSSASTGTQARVLNGIDYANTPAVTIDSCYVGGITTVSLATTNSEIQGIVLSGGGANPHKVINNVVEFLSAAFGNTSNNIPAVVGIRNIKTAGTEDISNNVIQYLISNSAAATRVEGIMYGNSATIVGSLNANRISNLIGAGNTSGVIGIFVYWGVGTVSNNQISLTNSPSTSNTFVYNIWDDAGTNGWNYFYNSLYCGGTQTAPTLSSANFLRTGTTTINIKNNIFYNERIGAAVLHFNIANNSSPLATAWAAGASNRNLFVNLTSTSVGLWTTAGNLTTWQSESSGDANSIYNTTAALPSATLFANTATGDLRTLKCIPADNAGVAVTTLDDYYGAVRSLSTPTIGSTELANPVPSVVLSRSNNLCAGNAVTYTATPTNGGGSPNYDFRVNGISVQSGSANTLINPTLNPGDVVDCEMTSSDDCAIPSTGTSNSFVVCGTLTWQGGTSTWLTPSNWLPAVSPNNCALDVIIPAGTPNDPDISTPISIGSISFPSTTVNIDLSADLTVCGNITGAGAAAFSGAGKVIMTGAAPTVSADVDFDILRLANATGANLTGAINIYESLELASGAATATNLTFKSTAQNDYSILNNFGGNTGSITGTIHAERYVPVLGTNQHHMGSPIAGTTIADFGTAYGPGTPGYVVPLPTCDEDESAVGTPYSSVFQWHEEYPANAICPLSGWEALTGGAAQAGKGYSVYRPQGVLTISGVPNQGNSYSVTGLGDNGWSSNTLQTTGSFPAVYGSGWHLVANSYLAAYTLNNPVGFDDAAVFLTSGPWQGTYQSLNMATGRVAPFQGFMVHTSGGTTFTFNKANLSTNTTTNFYRTLSESTLNVQVSGNGFNDITYVEFNRDATNRFDASYDARKLQSKSGQPTLYTFTNGMYQSVNVNQSIEETPNVPMGLRPGRTGTFTFTVEGINTFDPTSYIYLEDLVTGQWHDLRQNASYTFSMNKTDNPNRFVLHFTPAAVIRTTDAACSTAGSIAIEQAGTAAWQYAISNAQGTTISTGTVNSNSPAMVQVPQGAYTLSLTDNSGYNVTKNVLVSGTSPITASMTASASSAEVQEALQFNNTTANAASTSWSFGDGTQSSDANATHTYNTPGVYTVTLTVTNTDGCQSTASQVITVSQRNTTGIAQIANSQIRMWSNGKNVFADFTKMKNVEATIEIYNIIGQKLSSDKFNTSGVYTKALNITEAAYVIMNIRNGDEVMTKKLFVTEK